MLNTHWRRVSWRMLQVTPGVVFQLITAKLSEVGSNMPSSPDSSSDSSTGSPHHVYDGPNIEAENCLPGVVSYVVHCVEIANNFHDQLLLVVLLLYLSVSLSSLPLSVYLYLSNVQDDSDKWCQWRHRLMQGGHDCSEESNLFTLSKPCLRMGHISSRLRKLWCLIMFSTCYFNEIYQFLSTILNSYLYPTYPLMRLRVPSVFCNLPCFVNWYDFFANCFSWCRRILVMRSFSSNSLTLAVNWRSPSYETARANCSN